MRIISKEKVTFGIRLKKLMKDKGMTQERLASLVINPSTDSPISTNSIKKWLNDGVLKRNRDQIILQLAQIFDVDVKYLEGTQVEEKKIKSSTNDLYVNVPYINKSERFAKFLESIGITYGFVESGNVKHDKFKIIEGGYEYTLEDDLKEGMKISLTIDGMETIYTFDQFNLFMSEVEDFIKFKITNHK